MVQVRLLGPVDVVDDLGTVHSPGSALRRTLLALFGLHATKVLTADWLMENVWAGEPPESGRRALRFHISQLRKELGDGDLIETRPGGYRLVLAAVFDGLNRYLGNFIGEFLGELSFSVFFVLSGVGLLRHPRAPRWLCWWGIATGVLGLIGMWRNVTSAVDGVAAVNNLLLPAWMIGFGLWLVIAGRKTGRVP